MFETLHLGSLEILFQLMLWLIIGVGSVSVAALVSSVGDVWARPQPHTELAPMGYAELVNIVGDSIADYVGFPIIHGLKLGRLERDIYKLRRIAAFALTPSRGYIHEVLWVVNSRIGMIERSQLRKVEIW
jgi:hypothetical protein